MFRQLVLTAVASSYLFVGIGCKNCGKNRNSRNDSLPPPPGGNPYLDPPIPSAGGSTFPPPFPSGDRIPPPSVPTVPSDGGAIPPPEIPDSRGSLRIDPAFPPPSPSPALPPAAYPIDTPPPPASIPNDVQPPPPLPKQNRELLLPDPLPGGSAPTVPTSPTDTLIGSPRTAPPRGFLEEPIQSPLGTPTRSAYPPASPLPASPPPSVPLNNDVPPVNRSLPPSATPSSMPSTTSNAPVDRAPIGVPGFAAIGGVPGVYGGRRPTIDGFDTLKSAGIRTVLYLHGPDADVTAAKELAEKRGLRFESLSVSPQTLVAVSPQFNGFVGSPTFRPLFVCDDTGERAGALWYLYFRKVELLGDDAARVRATPLGLRNADDWLANIASNRR